MLIDRFPGIHHNISIHRMGRTATIIVGSFIFIILLIFKLTRFWRYKDITMGRPVGIGKTPGQPYSFDNIPFKIKIVIEGSALTFIDIIQCSIKYRVSLSVRQAFNTASHLIIGSFVGINFRIFTETSIRRFLCIILINRQHIPDT